MRIALALACLASLVLPAPAQALPDATWLIAIGNNLGDAGEEGLLYAQRDAREVTEVFRRLGGVSSRRVVLLLDEDAQTTRQTLIDVNASIRKEKGSTALVVYYSGHADAGALHQGGTHFAFNTLRNMIAESDAKMRLLIVDACRSGGVSRVKGVAAAKPFVIEAAESAVEGFAIITSSAAGETSQESDRLRGSFFSHHLVNGLRGAADKSGDGRVSLDEAYAYAYSQTLRSSGRTLTLQHPTFNFAVKGKGEVVLSRLASADRLSGQLQLADPAVYLISELRDGGPVVAELSPARPQATIALPAKRYFVQQRLPREFREFNVMLGKGASVQLAGLPYRSLKYDRLVRMRGAVQTTAHAVMMMGGVESELIEGEGPTANMQLGYRLDLPWFSPTLRLRYGRVQDAGDDGETARTRTTWAAGLLLERFLDLQHLSVSLGLLFEGGLHLQVFDTDNAATDRAAWSGAFGALLALERSLGPFALRIDAGPTATVLRRDAVEQGATVSTDTGAVFAWRGAAGLLWRF